MWGALAQRYTTGSDSETSPLQKGCDKDYLQGLLVDNSESLNAPTFLFGNVHVARRIDGNPVGQRELPEIASRATTKTRHHLPGLAIQDIDLHAVLYSRR